MRFETYGDLIIYYYSSQISKVRRESSLIRPSTSNFQFCTISPNRRVLTPCPLSLLGSRRRLGFWDIWASLLDALHVLFCPPSPPCTCPARIWIVAGLDYAFSVQRLDSRVLAFTIPCLAEPLLLVPAGRIFTFPCPRRALSAESAQYRAFTLLILRSALRRGSPVALALRSESALSQCLSAPRLDSPVRAAPWPGRVRVAPMLPRLGLDSCLRRSLTRRRFSGPRCT